MKMRCGAALCLFGAVLAGLFTSGGVYLFFVAAVLNPLTAHTGEEPEALLGLAFLLFLPIGLLCGSALTGFISRPYLKRPRLAALALAPGFYMALIFVVPTILYGTMESFFSFMMAAALAWWCISYAGVLGGGYLRVKWTKGGRHVKPPEHHRDESQ